MSDIKIDTSGIMPLIARIDPARDKMAAAVAIQVKKDTEEYVPFLNGNLRLNTRVSGSKIIYGTPYARYLYAGKVMKGPLHGPKYATDKDLDIKKSGTKKQTAHWFDRSKKDNLPTWQKVSKKAFLKYVKK